MHSNRSTVLVVDDEDELINLYATMLSDDYDILTASSGEEALEKVDAETDVVLLDRRMHELSGDEVLAKIREQGLDVRVGMITGVRPDLDIAEMDFDDYLVKPVERDEINKTVEQLLALSDHDRQTQELFAVAKKKAALDGTIAESQLRESEEYDDLVSQFEELDAEISNRIDDMPERFFQSILSSVNKK